MDLHLDFNPNFNYELTFLIADNDDDGHLEDGLFFSENGVDFIKVLDFVPDIWCNQYGGFPPIRINQLAEENGLQVGNDFVIRFQQHDDGDFGFAVLARMGFTWIMSMCMSPTSNIFQ